MSFVILGHRGMGPTARIKDLPENFLPENTLVSFQESLDLGADGLEFDVQLTQDGELAVIHTDQMKRIAKDEGIEFEDAEKLSSQFNMASLAAYDVGNGHNVPKLREVLDFIVERNEEYRLQTGKNLVVNIELKSDGTAAPVYDMISEYIADGRLDKDDFVFNSFEWDRLRELRACDDDLKIMPAIKTVQLFGEENVIIPGWRVKEGTPYTDEGLDRLKAFHEEVGVHAFDCIIFDLRPEMIEFAEQNGVGLFTSTSNENVSAGSIQGSLSIMIDASRRLKFTGFRADNVDETRKFVDAIRSTKSLIDMGKIREEDVQLKDTSPQRHIIDDITELTLRPSSDEPTVRKNSIIDSNGENHNLAPGIPIDDDWQQASDGSGVKKKRMIDLMITRHTPAANDDDLQAETNTAETKVPSIDDDSNTPEGFNNS